MQEAKVIPIESTKEISPVKYPIYRKYKCGGEYQKIVTATSVLHITNVGSFWNISYDTDTKPDHVTELLADPAAEPCSRDAFEQAYGKAQWTLCKINTIQ